MLTYYRKCQIKDPELLKAVTPNYTVGCKRVMISNDWYPAIARKNVRVVPRPVKTLCEDGLIADDGTHVPCDVVILGTGFETQRLDFHSGFDIEGKDGVKLFDFWQREGAMKAYKGITIPHLPNYFVTMGPNTNLSHNSVVYMIEHQIEYIIQAMKYAQVNNKKTIEVKRKPFDEFNEGQQESLKRSVWNNGGCTSWYLDGTKHNTSIWGLGFTFRYRNATKNFDPEAYTIV
jgi:cation diffusion facilitator CzcD-associated flavoprotein CzcO